MPKHNLTWRPTDAQFLEALLLATGGEGGATLQDVLLMADAIDGTVFALREVEEALEKLIAIHYVSVLKGKLSLSPVFLQAHAQKEEADEQKQLLQLLQTQELTEQRMEAARSIFKKISFRTATSSTRSSSAGNTLSLPVLMPFTRDRSC